MSVLRDMVIFVASPYVEYWNQVKRYWQAKLLERKPGWVVVAWDWEEGGEDYHAFYGGVRFGMDYRTGRFPNRASAQRYADWRNSAEAEIHSDGAHFYAEHDTMTTTPLKETY